MPNVLAPKKVWSMRKRGKGIKGESKENWGILLSRVLKEGGGVSKRRNNLILID